MLNFSQFLKQPSVEGVFAKFLKYVYTIYLAKPRDPVTGQEPPRSKVAE